MIQNLNFTLLTTSLGFDSQLTTNATRKEHNSLITGTHNINHVLHVTQVIHLLQTLVPFFGDGGAASSKGAARVVVGETALELLLLPLSPPHNTSKGYESLLHHPEHVQRVERPIHPKKLEQNRHSVIHRVTVQQTAITRGGLRVAEEDEKQNETGFFLNRLVRQRAEVRDDLSKHVVVLHLLADLTVQLYHDDQEGELVQ